MNILIGYLLIPLLFENLCLEKKQLGIPENLSVSLTTFSTMEAQRTDNFSTCRFCMVIRIFILATTANDL